MKSKRFKQLPKKTKDFPSEEIEKLVTEGNLPIIKITENKRYMRLSDLHRYLNTKMVNQPQEVNQESQPDFQWNNIWSK